MPMWRLFENRQSATIFPESADIDIKTKQTLKICSSYKLTPTNEREETIMARKKTVKRIKSAFELEVLAAKKAYEKAIETNPFNQVFPLYEDYRTLEASFDTTRDGIVVIREKGHELLDAQDYEAAIKAFQRAKSLAHILDMVLFSEAKSVLADAYASGDKERIVKCRYAYLLTQVSRNALRTKAVDLQNKAAYANGQLELEQDPDAKAKAAVLAKELTDEAISLTMRVDALDEDYKSLNESDD